MGTKQTKAMLVHVCSVPVGMYVSVVVVCAVNTSSVDEEHELLTKVPRVGAFSDRLHHQVSRWICRHSMTKKFQIQATSKHLKLKPKISHHPHTLEMLIEG